MPKPLTPAVWASGKAFGFQPSAAQQAQGFDYIATVRPSTGAPITDDHDWPLNSITTALKWIMDQVPDHGFKQAAFRDVGTSAGQIPDMSSFSSSNTVQFLPGGWILQIVSVPSIPALGGLVVTYPTPFPNTVLGIVTGSGATSPNVPTFNTQSIDKNSFKAWNQSGTAATQVGNVLAIGR